MRGFGWASSATRHFLYILLAGGALATASIALAQTHSAAPVVSDSEVVAAFLAYRAAIEAGDAEASLMNAKRAYELGEQEWGADRAQTAILALNYADELLHAGDESNDARATELADRCSEINTALALQNSLIEVQCRLLAGELYFKRGKKRHAQTRFEEAIEAADGLDDPDAKSFAARAYLGLGALAMPQRGGNRLAFKKAAVHGRDAAELLKTSERPKDIYAVGLGCMLQGYHQERLKKWRGARDFYFEAYSAFERAGARHSSDWNRALGRMSLMRYYGKLERRSELGPAKKSIAPCDEAPAVDSSDMPCSLKRPSPHYPLAKEYYGQYGYVVVRYSIEADGSTSDIVILDSWPGDGFDAAVRNAMKRWTHRPAVVDDAPVKTEDWDVLFTFAVER